MKNYIIFAAGLVYFLLVYFIILSATPSYVYASYVLSMAIALYSGFMIYKKKYYFLLLLGISLYHLIGLTAMLVYQLDAR